MKGFTLVFLVLAFAALFVGASIPSRQGLRFDELRNNEVTGEHLGPNSVSLGSVQDFSIDTQALRNQQVTASKISSGAVNAEHVSPGAITSSGASLDLVQLRIKANDTIPAASQLATVNIPEGAEAVQPAEAIADDDVQVDNPALATSYRVEGKARGPGVILGWYPTQNGHFLRYQSSRALRGIVCSAIDVIDIQNACSCTSAGCTCDTVFQDVDFNSEITDCNQCTVLDCADPVTSTQNDPMCLSGSANQRMNPLDVDGDHLPDRCNPYTSVEDVNNPQEGVPVYSPSVERVTIDDTGRVEMRFFGRGTIEGAHDDIIITVVVLLDDQYGA